MHIKSTAKYIVSLSVHVLFFPFHLFPVKKNKVVFTGLTGGEGYEYSGNLRYLSDYLIEQTPEQFHISWIVYQPEQYQKDAPASITFYRHYSLKAIKEMLTAKVIVTSGSYAPWFPFRKQQYLINTWHGGGAYKKIENDKPDADWATKKRAEFCAKNIDLFLSSCRAASEKLFRHAFLYQGEIMECGMPRNDFLVRQETSVAATEVRSQFAIAEEEKILLYAPTYRDTEKEMRLDFDRLRAEIEKNGTKWRIFYRAHRYSGGEGPVKVSGTDIIDVTRYPDMQKLLAAADMLITDYSSCIWDYAFLYRPCYLYTPDMEEYLAKTGFYTPVAEWPFPTVKTEAELAVAIRAYDPASLQKEIKRHLTQMGSCETGHACEAALQRINDVCKEN